MFWFNRYVYTIHHYSNLRSEQAVIEERVRQVEELRIAKQHLEEKLGQRENELKKEVWGFQIVCRLQFLD